MSPSPSELSRRLSHALRHEPELYGIRLDDSGWTSLALLVDALNLSDGGTATSADVVSVVANSSKKRLELDGDRIRAVYGHSTGAVGDFVPTEPPAVLFHGTVSESASAISVDGLKPMSRKFVHLSADRETAESVATRHGEVSVLFEVDAAAAAADGVEFAHPNDSIWLARAVPAMYLRVAGPAAI